MSSGSELQSGDGMQKQLAPVVRAYMAAIGRRGGKAGTGVRKQVAQTLGVIAVLERAMTGAKGGAREALKSRLIETRMKLERLRKGAVQ